MYLFLFLFFSVTVTGLRSLEYTWRSSCAMTKTTMLEALRVVVNSRRPILTFPHRSWSQLNQVRSCYISVSSQWSGANTVIRCRCDTPASREPSSMKELRSVVQRQLNNNNNRHVHFHEQCSYVIKKRPFVTQYAIWSNPLCLWPDVLYSTCSLMPKRRLPQHKAQRAKR